MAYGDERETNLIIRATDLAAQPLKQLVQTVRSLTQTLKEQAEASRTGEASASNWGKALNDVVRVQGALLQQRKMLEGYGPYEEKMAAAAQRTAQAQQNLSSFRQNLPAEDDRTPKQIRDLATLESALRKAETAQSRSTEAWTRYSAKLEKIGVDIFSIEAAHKSLGTTLLEVTSALNTAGQADQNFITNKQRATEYVEFFIKALRDQDQAMEASIAGMREGLQHEISLFQAEETALRNRNAQLSAGVDANVAAMAGSTQHEIAVFEAMTKAEEAARRKQVQEGIAAHEAQLSNMEDATRQELAMFQAMVRAEEDGRTKQVRDGIAAHEKQASAMEEATRHELSLVQQQFEIEDRLAASRKAAADVVAQTRTQVEAVATRQAPVLPPPPTARESVSTALAGPGGTGRTDLFGLSSQIDQANAALLRGKANATEYSGALRSLATAEGELRRQAGIVDNFEKARKAAADAALEFEKAVREVQRLNTIAANPSSSQAEVDAARTGMLAQQRRIGSAAEGSGLAGAALRAREDMNREAASLASIGVSVDQVGAAYARLTQLATQASQSRITQNEIEANSLRKIAVQAIQAGVGAERGVAAAQSPTGIMGAGAQAREAVSGAMSKIPSRFGDLAEIQNTDEAIQKLNEQIAKSGTFASSYQRNMTEVYSVQRKLAGDASLIDNFRKQSAAAGQAETNFLGARDEMLRLATAMRTVDQPTREMAHDLTAAQRSMEALAKTSMNESQALEKMRAQLRAAGIDERDLDAATAKLVTQATKLQAVQSQVQFKETGIFGLRPYQLKNLEYQLGDIWTQLSLGQGILRTFNAQGDQILQILDVSYSKLKTLAIYGIPAAAAVWLVVEALFQLKERNSTIREFNAQLGVNADGVKYSSQAMFDAIKTIQHYGSAFADAKTAITEFVQAGIRQDRLEDFGRASQAIVDIYGKKMPEAVKEVTSAFTKDLDAILKLNEQYNFLTAEEAERLKALQDEGRAEEMRAVAFDKFSEKMLKARGEVMTPMRTEVNQLRESWDNFLTSLSQSEAFQTAVSGLKNLLEWMTRFNREGGGAGAAGTARDALAEAQAQRKALERQLEAAKGGTAVSAGGGMGPEYTYTAPNVAAIREIEQQLTALNQRIATLKNSADVDLIREQLRALEEQKKRLEALGPAATPQTVEAEFNGIKFQIAEQFKERMLGFLKELSATGYNVKDIQGFSQRNIDGTNTPSFHGLAGGAAVDINPSENARGTAGNLPWNVADMARRWGLGSGAAFNDPMHFSFAQREGGMFAIPQSAGAASSRDKIMQMVTQRIAELTDQLTKMGYSAETAGKGIGVLDAGAEKAKVAAVSFADALEKETNLRKAERQLLGPERLAADQTRLAEFRRQLEERAAKSGVVNPATDAIAGPQIAEAVEVERRKLTNAREQAERAARDRILAGEQALAEELIALANKVTGNDKTNIEARLRAFDLEQDKMRLTADRAKSRGVTQVLGIPLEQFEVMLDKAREEARSTIIMEGAEAIVSKVVQQRKTEYDIILEGLKSGAETITSAYQKALEVTSRFATPIKEAVDAARKAIAAVPATPSTRAAGAKLDTLFSAGTEGGIDKDTRNVNQEFLDKSMADLRKLDDARKTVAATEHALVRTGERTTLDAEKNIRAEYAKTDKSYRQAIDTAQDMIDKVYDFGNISPEAYEKASAALDRYRSGLDYTSDRQKELIKGIEQSFVSNATRAFDTIAQSLGGLIAGTKSWKDVLSDVGAAFANFAAGILIDIAKMIIEQQMLMVIQMAMKAMSFAHGGGDIGLGQANMTRAVNPMAFLAAPRMHAGGYLGLADDEVPVILQRGERVLSKSQVRTMNNAAASGNQNSNAGGVGIRNVLAVGDNEIASAMSGAHGEKVVLNILKRNAPTIRNWVR